MSLDEGLTSEIQKLDPSSMIELYELDATELGGDVVRFHNGTNKLAQNLVWQGNEYIRFPIHVTGFEQTGQGQFPRPIASVSNVLSAITTLLLQYDDLIGAKFTRKRTLLKYLDAVNFPGGVNPTEDPDVYFPDDVFYVDRKSVEDRDKVQFELASAADLQGVRIPRRVIVKSVCPWVYRGADCGYTGAPIYGANDELLPDPVSPEGIAMRAAYDAVGVARAAYDAAQATVVSTYNTLLAAQVYTQETQYSKLTPPLYHVRSNTYENLPTVAVWNGVEVSLGSTYVAGAYRDEGVHVGYYSNRYYFFYEIIKYSRDEAAVTAAQTAYDAALVARASAQSDLDAALADLDAAVAAIPPNDPVFTQDICGKRLTSCKLRFGADSLNFGGFPGVGK